MLILFRLQILNHGGNIGRLSDRAFRVLRSLAINSCQVPNRYKINSSLVFDTDPVRSASDGFSEVYKRNLYGGLVAVKTLRISQETDMVLLQKVRYTGPRPPLH